MTKTRQTLRVLVIEDSPSDAGLIAEALEGSESVRFELELRSELAAGLTALAEQGSFDAVMLDLNLPDSFGLDTFFRIHERFPEVPIIILSCAGNEEIAVEAVRAGAQDYVFKDHLDDRTMPRAVRYAFCRTQTLKQLQRATRLKSAFLADMSHEIRTPLNGILGMISLLVDTPLNPQQREYLKIARDSGEHLLAVVNEVLDISKIEAGKIELDLNEFDLAATLSSTLAMFEERARTKHIRLHASIDAGVPRRVRGDELKLRQVLVNLLSNAIKFTSLGGVALQVKPIPSLIPGHLALQFSVQDSGIGIAPGQLERIFAAYAQGEASTPRRYGGTGLGLSISRTFVHLMGGEIGVTSTLGLGSRFEFTANFGRAKDEGAPMNERLNPPAPAQVAMPADLGPIGQGRAVLVVEDNLINQKVIKGMLIALGFTVTLAATGHAGIDSFRRHCFSVVLMDYQLPDLNGFETVRRLQAFQDPERLVPIVAVTANALAGERERCLEAGMNDYLTKPLTMESLRTCLLRVLAEGAPELPANEGVLEAEVLEGLHKLEREAGGTLLHDVVGVFAAESACLIARLDASIRHHDWRQAVALADTLKARARLVGAHELASLSGELETWAHTAAGEAAPIADRQADGDDKLAPYPSQLLDQLSVAYSKAKSALRFESQRLM